MAELTFEKKKVTRFRNKFNPDADIVAVMIAVLKARVPGELRIGIPGNGGVNFIEFLEKEKTETVYYDPLADEKI
jgi:hypothetical protein